MKPNRKNSGTRLPKADFTLVPRNWYAWQMMPGYADGPYYSPIWVRTVTPRKTGKGLLELVFLNAAYAQGVQDSSIDLGILYRGSNYLVAKLIYDADDSGRCAIISEIEFRWLEKFCPSLLNERPPESYGRPATETASAYLDAVFKPDDSPPLKDALGETVLVEQRSEQQQLHIGARILPSGDLQISGHDLSKNAKAFGSDVNEYEYWITISRENKDRVLLLLLEEFYQSGSSGDTELKTLLDKHSIPFESANYF